MDLAYCAVQYPASPAPHIEIGSFSSMRFAESNDTRTMFLAVPTTLDALSKIRNRADSPGTVFEVTRFQSVYEDINDLIDGLVATFTQGQNLLWQLRNIASLSVITERATHNLNTIPIEI